MTLDVNMKRGMLNSFLGENPSFLFALTAVGHVLLICVDSGSPTSLSPRSGRATKSSGRDEEEMGGANGVQIGRQVQPGPETTRENVAKPSITKVPHFDPIGVSRVLLTEAST